MNGFEVEGETWSERETEREREGHHGTYERERGKKGPTQWPRAPAGGHAGEGGEALF